MDLNETAVFVRVVQAGSFSAAARQLGLPTSTVSTRASSDKPTNDVAWPRMFSR